MDNHVAVSVGDLEKYSVALPIVEPKFSEDCPESSSPRKGGRTDASKRRRRWAAHFRRHHSRGIRQMVKHRWWTRTAMQSAKPSTRASRERSGKSCATSRAVNIRQSSTSRKAETLWRVREAKANGDEYYGQDSQRQIENRVAVRQAL